MDDSKEFVYAVKRWDKNYHKMKKLDKEIQNLKDKKLKYELEKREAEKKKDFFCQVFITPCVMKDPSHLT